MEAVRVAVTYDRVDITNLAAFEVLLRRAQTIEYAHMEKTRDQTTGKGSAKGHGGGSLTVEEQDAFAGTTKAT
eukprot:8496613-Heterocapsa_arctica.AAC.1